jgi:DNA-binding MarR family transcriptional regulator
LSILEEVVPVALQGLKAIVQDESMSGLEKLRTFIRYHLKMVEEQGDILNVYIGESRHLSELSKKAYVDTQRHYADYVKQIVLQIQEESQEYFRKLDPTITTYAILGMCNWPIMWYGKEGRFNIDEIADQFYKILSESIT